MTSTFAAACETILGQCVSITHLVDPVDYMAQSDGQSSIGAHMRHVIEYCEQYIKAVQAGVPINYDARQRDLEVEQNPMVASARIEKIKHGLAAIYQDDALMAHATFAIETMASDRPAATVATSVAREMMYVVSQHAVHHLALIQAIARAQGYAFQNGFGVAASTIQYRENA